MEIYSSTATGYGSCKLGSPTPKSLQACGIPHRDCILSNHMVLMLIVSSYWSNRVMGFKNTEVCVCVRVRARGQPAGWSSDRPWFHLSQ